MSADSEFKAAIVRLIMDGDAERAVGLLADHHEVIAPKLRVGLPRGHRIGTLGCYSPAERVISVLNGETLRDPAVVVHEFYHHLRTSVDGKHRGNERKAQEFARGYLDAYASAAPARRRRV